jgi:hypothetical protein
VIAAAGDRLHQQPALAVDQAGVEPPGLVTSLEMSPSSIEGERRIHRLVAGAQDRLGDLVEARLVPITLNIGEEPYFWLGAVVLRETAIGIVK